MTLTKIESHKDEMLNLLVERFKNSEHINSVLSIQAVGLQELEQVFFDLRDIMSVQLATGKNLDNLGAKVGQLRLGLADPEYRSAIITKIAINNNSGTVNSILETVRVLANPVSIEYFPLYPANFGLNIKTDNFDTSLIPLIRNLPVAGVGEVQINILPDTDLLRYGGYILGEYNAILIDNGQQFNFTLIDQGVEYNAVFNDYYTLNPDTDDWAGYGGIILTSFLAVDFDGARLTFNDGTPWRLQSEGDNEYYTTVKRGVYSGAIE